MIPCVMRKCEFILSSQEEDRNQTNITLHKLQEIGTLPPGERPNKCRLLAIWDSKLDILLPESVPNFGPLLLSSVHILNLLKMLEFDGHPVSVAVRIRPPPQIQSSEIQIRYSKCCKY